jgi:phage terminase small subunit
MARKPRKPRQRGKAPGKKVNAADRLERFCQEYVVHNRGTDAAIAAGFSKAGARVRASELLARPEVQARLDVLKLELAAKTGITAQRVLEELYDIAQADPRDLCELRRICCRYCHGKGNRYQRTPQEMVEYRKNWDLEFQKKAKENGLSKSELAELIGGEFDEQGGIGYDPRKQPNPDCPECFGDGKLETHFKDVRNLKGRALKLYAGVEETQHGLKIRMRDQDGALDKVARSVALYRDGLKLVTQPGSQTPGAIERTIDDFFARVNGADIGIGPSKGKPCLPPKST